MAEVSQHVNGVLGKYGTGTLFVNYDEQTGGATRNSENDTNFEAFADIKVKKILTAQAVGDQQIGLQVGCLVKYIDTSYGNTLWDGGGVIDLESSLGSTDNINSISVPAEAKSIGLNSSDYALFLEQTLKWVSVPYSKMQFKLLAHVSGESANQVGLEVGDGNASFESADMVGSVKLAKAIDDLDEIREILADSRSVDKDKLDNLQDLQQLSNALLSDSAINEFASLVSKDYQAGQSVFGGDCAEYYLPYISDEGSIYFVPDKH